MNCLAAVPCTNSPPKIGVLRGPLRETTIEKSNAMNSPGPQKAQSYVLRLVYRRGFPGRGRLRALEDLSCMWQFLAGDQNADAAEHIGVAGVHADCIFVRNPDLDALGLEQRLH